MDARVAATVSKLAPHTLHTDDLAAAVHALDALASTDPDWARLAPTPAGAHITDDLITTLAGAANTLLLHLDPLAPPLFTVHAVHALHLLASSVPAVLLQITSPSPLHPTPPPSTPGQHTHAQPLLRTPVLISASFSSHPQLAISALALLRLSSLVASGTVSVLPLTVADLPPDDLASCAACSICQLDFAPDEWVVPLPCGHIFHRSEILRWLGAQPSCPSCRSPAYGPLPHTVWSIQSRLALLAAGLHLDPDDPPDDLLPLPALSDATPAALDTLGPRAPLTDDHLHAVLGALAAPAAPYDVRLAAARALARCVHDNAWGAHVVGAHMAETAAALADAIALDLDVGHTHTPLYPLAAAAFSLLGSLVAYQTPLPLFLHADELFLGHPHLLDVIWSAVPLLLVPAAPDFYAAAHLVGLVTSYAATGSVADVLRSTGFVPFVIHALHHALAAPAAHSAPALVASALKAIKILLRPDPFGVSHACANHPILPLALEPESLLDLAWYRADGVYDIPCNHVALAAHGSMLALAHILDDPASSPHTAATAATAAAALTLAGAPPPDSLILAAALARPDLPPPDAATLSHAVAAMASSPPAAAALLTHPLLDALAHVVATSPGLAVDHAANALYNLLITTTPLDAAAALAARPLIPPLVARIEAALGSNSTPALLPPLRLLHVGFHPDPADDSAIVTSLFLVAGFKALVLPLLALGGDIAVLALDIVSRVPPLLLAPLLPPTFPHAALAAAHSLAPNAASLALTLAHAIVSADGWCADPQLDADLASALTSLLTTIRPSPSSAPLLATAFRIAPDIWDVSARAGPWLTAANNAAAALLPLPTPPPAWLLALLAPVLRAAAVFPRHLVAHAPDYTALAVAVLPLVATGDTPPPLRAALEALLCHWLGWPQHPLETALLASPAALDGVEALVLASGARHDIVARLACSPSTRSWLASSTPLVNVVVEGYARGPASEGGAEYAAALGSLVAAPDPDHVEWWLPAEAAHAQADYVERVTAVLAPTSGFASFSAAWTDDHVSGANALGVLAAILGAVPAAVDEIGSLALRLLACAGADRPEALLVLQYLDAAGVWPGGDCGDEVYAAAHPGSPWAERIRFCAPALSFPAVQNACLGLAATFVDRAVERGDEAADVVALFRRYVAFAFKLVAKLVEGEVAPGVLGPAAAQFDAVVAALRLVEIGARARGALGAAVANVLERRLVELELVVGEAEWGDEPVIEDMFVRIRNASDGDSADAPTLAQPVIL